MTKGDWVEFVAYLIFALACLLGFIAVIVAVWMQI